MGASAADVYTEGNLYEGTATQRLVGGAAQPFPAPPVTTHAANAFEPIVETHAGCLPRDSVDQAYIDRTAPWQAVDGKPLRNP